MSFTELEIGAVITALTRAGALAATAPVIGDAPVRARLIFVVAIAFGVGLNRSGVAYVDLPMVVLVEVAMGLLTGATARMVLASVAVAGQLIGLSLGLGFAQQYDLHAGESAGTIRMMLTTLASLAFLAVGGLEAVVRSASASPSHAVSAALLGPELIRAATASFATGLTLAGPIVLAALVGNIGLAVMNRAAPAVNVFSISLAAVMLLGGLVLLATATDLVGSIKGIARTAAAVFAP
jgi:flagellar biosynthesis protein FliR